MRTARAEVFDWLLVVAESQLRQILAEFVEHYNRELPHRSLDRHPPHGPSPARAQPAGPITRVDHLGGLIHQYRRAA